uniref:Uncharacterized protein n=1 Tax=Arundo donax TaxID=35708 RepID=A0A0A9F6Y8_ARUDO
MIIRRVVGCALWLTSVCFPTAAIVDSLVVELFCPRENSLFATGNFAYPLFAIEILHFPYLPFQLLSG